MKHYKFIVIGSGLSSFFFLKGLDKKFFKTTCVIEGNSYSKNKYRQNNNTNFFLSNKFGGLASTWLGGYSEFKIDDLNKMQNGFKKRLFKTHQQFNKVYNKIYKKYFSSKKFLSNNILDSNKIKIFDNKTLLDK